MGSSKPQSSPDYQMPLLISFNCSHCIYMVCNYLNQAMVVQPFNSLFNTINIGST